MTRTLLIHIDGCRADTLAAAATPAIHRLKAGGAWTYGAVTVTPSVTLPVHFSIFTSMAPTSHGVLSNAADPAVSRSAPNMVQWFQSLGKTCAMYYNWEYLRELSPPGYLDRSIFFDTLKRPDGDMIIAEAAAADMISAQPEFTFVYLGCPDEVGHSKGFESPEYALSIEKADQAVAHLLNRLDLAGIRDQYSILLQSDHGGMGNHHTQSVPEVMMVPWILSGPKIRPREIVHPEGLPPVSVLDTAPTLALCMDLMPHPLWEGKAVTQAFSDSL